MQGKQAPNTLIAWIIFGYYFLRAGSQNSDKCFKFTMFLRPSVCPFSVLDRISVPTGLIFLKFDTAIIFENPSRKLKFL